MIKRIRNSVSDTVAELVYRLPVLEKGFVGFGPVSNRVLPFHVFYRRALQTICERWREGNKRFRKVKIGSCEFVFDVTDFTMCNWYFYRQLFEPETTRLVVETVREGETFLDIGANRGYMSVMAGKKVGPTGKVYSFEPNPVIYAALNEHLRLNDLAEIVETSTVALSDTNASNTTFFVSTSDINSGLSSLTPVPELLLSKELSDQNTIKVETITLDSWLSTKPIQQPIDFIKIDVEGAEMLVLNGALDTLANRPPKRWVIETQPQGPVADLLQSYGYSLKVLDPAGTHANLLFTHPSYQNTDR